MKSQNIVQEHRETLKRVRTNKIESQIIATIFFFFHTENK